MSLSKIAQKVQIPDHIRQLKAYEPGKSGDQSLGPRALLCSNENNLGPSPLAVEAMQAALKDAASYPDPSGIRLREALAEKYCLSPSQIALGNGSDELLYNLIHSFCEKGDEVLTAQNSFISIKVFTSLFQIPLQTVPLKSGYRFDLEGLLAHISQRTKIIYLCNPNNPTGTLFSTAELQHFLQHIPPHILVVVDEAYAEFAQSLSDDYPQAIQLNHPNVIVLRTFSKAYGLAAVRVGYAMGESELIEVLMKVKPIFSVNAIAQAGARAALEDESYLNQVIAHHKEELKRFYNTFDHLAIAYVPSFSNFVMIDLQEAHIAKKLYDQLEASDIKVRRLHAFGLPHCLRISIGTDEENRQFCTQLTHIWTQKLFATNATPYGQTALRPFHIFVLLSLNRQ